MEVHFVNVDMGDMAVLLLPDGTTMVVDCNITLDNKKRVVDYLSKVMGARTQIDVFVNTHRDADHMRGIKTLHSAFPILKIWDSGVPGTTTDTPEYLDYMDLRRKIGYVEVQPQRKWTFGEVNIRVMNSKRDEYSDPNRQSIVIKAEYGSCSTLFAGDTDYKPWKEYIVPFYGDGLKSTFLKAAHHGSITFFDDPSDQKHYYTTHTSHIKPEMTIVSVGPNSYGLPDDKAIELYKSCTTGSNQGNKVYTTQDQGNIKVVLRKDGTWTLHKNCH